MKKYLLILTFLLSTLISWGQYQPMDTLFNGTINVVGNDTLLYDSVNSVNTGMKLIQYTGELDLGYISCEEKGFIVIAEDTISLRAISTIGFRNYEGADTLFFQTSNKTLNSDLTTLAPKRVTRIGYYLTPTTDINNYWNGLVITASMHIVPDEYVSITAAIAVASVNDTIIVRKGYYNEGGGAGSLQYNKDGITTIAIAPVTITSTGGTAYNVFYFNPGELNGVIIDGLGTIDRGLTANAVKVVLNGCDIINHDLTAWARNGSMSEFNNGLISMVSGSLTMFQLTAYQYTLTVNESYLQGENLTSAWFYKFNTNDTSKLNVTYNKMLLGVSDVLTTTSANLDFNYNYLDIDTSSVNLFTFLSTTIVKTHNVIGNSITVGGASSAFGLLDATQNNYTFNIDNNTHISTFSEPYTFIQSVDKNNSFDIINNDFDVYTGQSIFLDSCLSGNTVNISNNNIQQHLALDDDGYSSISIINMPDDIECQIIGNSIYNPKYFGEVYGGHSCIFNSFCTNSKIKYNYLVGGGLSSLIYKGNGNRTENTNAVIQGNIMEKLLLKGQPKTKIYNNTFSNGNYGIRVSGNSDAGIVNGYADSCEIYNNILLGDTALIVLNSTGLVDTVFSDNNIIRGSTLDVFFTTTPLSFSAWQELGYDANSFNTDPLLDANLCPDSNSPAVFNGLNLGSPYNIGLVCGTTFPDPTTRAQTYPYYTIGAYVVDKQINSAVRVIGGGQWIFFNGVKNTKVGY